MKAYIFDGYLKAEQPVSIVLPMAAKINKVLSCATIPVVQADGAVVNQPILPATTFRGALRRAAYSNTYPDYMPLPFLYESLIGQDDQSENKGSVDLVQRAENRKNKPVVNLFGAGLSYKGACEIGHGIPEYPVKPIVVTGVRKDLDDKSEIFKSLPKEQQEAIIERTYLVQNDLKELKAQKKEIDKKRKKAFVDSKKATGYEKEQLLEEHSKCQSEIDEIESRIEAVTSGEDFQKKSFGLTLSTAHITSYNAMPQGTVMKHQMRLTDVDALPLFVGALNSLSLYPVLGGQVARGCGEISGHWSVKMIDGNEVVDMGTVSLGGFEPLKLTGLIKTLIEN